MSWLARTEVGGRCIGPPGQGLVDQCRPRSRYGQELRYGASLQAHWAYARVVPGYVRGWSLAVSGQCGQYMKICAYMYSMGHKRVPVKKKRSCKLNFAFRVCVCSAVQFSVFF